MRRAFLLLLVGLAGLLPGLDRLTPERQQELRVVLVAQNMADGGSWLIPEFQRSPRLKKPPLAYWAAAVCVKAARALGLPERIWVYRLPSGLCGIGLLFGIWLVGRRLIDDQHGYAAALLAAASFVFLRHARLAEADVMLSMFIVWSIWAGTKTASKRWPVPVQQGEIHGKTERKTGTGHPGPRRALIFWLTCGLLAGLGFLSKGVAALVVPPLALAGIWRFRRDLVRPRVGGLALALAAFALVALPWYLFIWNHPDGQAAMQAEAAALMGKNEHTGPIFYYGYTGLVQLLPLSLLVLWLPLRRLFPRKTNAAASPAKVPAAPLVWFGLVFVLLSILPSKQAHYTVLLLAPTALLAAVAALSWPRAARCFAEPAVARTAAILASLLLVLGLAYAHLVYPRTQPLAQLRDFTETARPELEQAPLVHVVGVNSAIFEFHVGQVVHNIDSARAALERARPGEAVLVIGDRERVDLPAVPPPRLERAFGDTVYALYVK